MEENFMNKTVFYIPAILYVVLVWFVTLGGIGSVYPGIFVWIALFLVGGFLLSKCKFWGGVFGIIPGINLIYMSTKDTGQVINELPLGIIILIFYVLCSSFVFYKEKKTRN